MAFPVVAAAVAGGGLLGSNAMSAYYDRHAASLAYERQVDLFDYIAAYNHPVAQMERLREAGLNPNLVYGGNAVGSVSSAPSVSGGNRSGGKELDIAGALQQYQQYRTGQAQEANLRVQNENLSKDTEIKQEQKEAERLDNIKTRLGIMQYLDTGSDDLSKSSASSQIASFARLGDKAYQPFYDEFINNPRKNPENARWFNDWGKAYQSVGDLFRRKPKSSTTINVDAPRPPWISRQLYRAGQWFDNYP